MKKILSFLMAAILMFSMSTLAASEENILSREEIPLLTEESGAAAGLKELGILKGTGEGLELERTITRAEAVCLIFRLHPENPGVLGMPSPEFSDMDNHWAYKEVTAAKKMGLVDGTSETTFEPDRLVTGKEFAKILLSMLGYTDVTIDNAYETAKEVDLLLNNFTKSVVYNNEDMLRSDAARLCFGALNAKMANGTMLYQKLIENGKYEYDDFYGVLFVGDRAAYTKNFVDKINEQMPEDKNYMFSPLSIKMAFAMAANGADGKTKEQILSALEIENLDEYNEYSKSLIEGYQKADILKLDIANALWLNESNTSQKFSDSYKNTLKTYYDAEVNGSTKDVIANEINGWVKEKTNDKIDSIITDELARDDRFIMALLNAVYFKGTWLNEFNENMTKKDIFTDRDGNEQEIDFMNKTTLYDYYNDGAVEVLALPYKNSVYSEEVKEVLSYDFDVSMYLIKGEYRDEELSNLIEAGSLKSKRITLSVPKFESDFDTSLIDIMNNLGVTDAFVDGKADFTKMFAGGNMYIMTALHKTYIKVDEKGTEAAAVTGFAGGLASIPHEPIVVKFDTPFTYVIRDDANGEVLFIGEYAFGKE